MRARRQAPGPAVCSTHGALSVPSVLPPPHHPPGVGTCLFTETFQRGPRGGTDSVGRGQARSDAEPDTRAETHRTHTDGKGTRPGDGAQTDTPKRQLGRANGKARRGSRARGPAGTHHRRSNATAVDSRVEASHEDSRIDRAASSRRTPAPQALRHTRLHADKAHTSHTQVSRSTRRSDAPRAAQSGHQEAARLRLGSSAHRTPHRRCSHSSSMVA